MFDTRDNDQREDRANTSDSEGQICASDSTILHDADISFLSYSDDYSDGIDFNGMRALSEGMEDIISHGDNK